MTGGEEFTRLRAYLRKRQSDIRYDILADQTSTRQHGQRRFVKVSEDHPLVGADTVASQLFSAAAAAPCPVTN
jgi:hypothetical protein